MRTPLIALTLALAVGCSDRNVELGSVDDGLRSGDETAPIVVAQCPAEDWLVQRACKFDWAGEAYYSEDELDVLPPTPPYRTYLELGDEWQFIPEAVDTQGDDARIMAFAAPYNVKDDPCCVEDDLDNRVFARASLTSEGAVLVTLDKALSVGTQVAVVFELEGLIEPRPGVDEPSVAEDTLSGMGYVFRFYVGGAPEMN